MKKYYFFIFFKKHLKNTEKQFIIAIIGSTSSATVCPFLVIGQSKENGHLVAEHV